MLPLIAGKEKKSSNVEVFLKRAVKFYNKLQPVDKEVVNRALLKKRFIRSLRRAAKITKDKYQKEYLLSIIPGFRKNEKIDKNLFQGTTSSFHLLFIPQKKIKGKASLLIEKDEEITAMINKYMSAVLDLAEKGELNRKIRFLPEKILMIAGKVVIPENFKRGVILYPAGEKTSLNYPLTYFLTGFYKVFIADSVLPISKKLYPEYSISGNDTGLYISALALHRLAHFIGPAIVKKEKTGKKKNGEKKEKREELKTPKDELKQFFQLIEELRADTDMIIIAGILSEKKILSKIDFEKMLKILILSKIAKTKNTKNTLSKQGTIIILNELFENGGITLNLASKTLRFDIDALKKSFKKIHEFYTDLEAKGKIKESKKYIEEKEKPGNRLKSILGFL